MRLISKSTAVALIAAMAALAPVVARAQANQEAVKTEPPGSAGIAGRADQAAGGGRAAGRCAHVGLGLHRRVQRLCDVAQGLEGEVPGGLGLARQDAGHRRGCPGSRGRACRARCPAARLRLRPPPNAAGVWDPTVVEKLKDVRKHLDGFEKATGDPLFIVEDIEKLLDEAGAASGTVTLDATKLAALKEQLGPDQGRRGRYLGRTRRDEGREDEGRRTKDETPRPCPCPSSLVPAPVS